MTYQRLSIEEFGKHLLESNDLDPVYVALHSMQLPPDVLGRWLLAYWCFYDCGVASYIAEREDDFWDNMLIAAYNELPTPFGTRWRRAAERRHFRGTQATRAVIGLMNTYGDHPERMAFHCSSILQPTCADVMKRVQEHRGFGPWIGFKVADMVDRVMEVPVSFRESEVFMFKDPTKAALMLFKEQGGTGIMGPHDMSTLPGYVSQQDAVAHSVAFLTHYFSDYQAPPLGDRPVGLQEVETILCKWKSHVNGHYPLFNDQDEIYHHLLPWLTVPYSDLAQKFCDHVPRN